MLGQNDGFYIAQAQAEALLASGGHNELPTAPGRSIWKIAFETTRDEIRRKLEPAVLKLGGGRPAVRQLEEELRGTPENPGK